MNGNTDVKTEPSVTDPVIDIGAVEVTDQKTPDETHVGSKNTNADNGKTEEFRIQGDELVAKVKSLIHEGNIRRIIVKNEAGVLSAALFPVLAAVGAIGAVVAHLTLVIEKRE
jgi:Domain of unknown function (DUF4342)